MVGRPRSPLDQITKRSQPHHRFLIVDNLPRNQESGALRPATVFPRCCCAAAAMDCRRPAPGSAEPSLGRGSFSFPPALCPFALASCHLVHRLSFGPFAVSTDTAHITAAKKRCRPPRRRQVLLPPSRGGSRTLEPAGQKKRRRNALQNLNRFVETPLDGGRQRVKRPDLTQNAAIKA